ncbi:MAG: hypothetical protein WD793_10800 [Steroidobacteraceae bacterium]
MTTVRPRFYVVLDQRDSDGSTIGGLIMSSQLCGRRAAELKLRQARENYPAARLQHVDRDTDLRPDVTNIFEARRVADGFYKD